MQNRFQANKLSLRSTWEVTWLDIKGAVSSLDLRLAEASCLLVIKLNLLWIEMHDDLPYRSTAAPHNFCMFPPV